MAIDENVTLKKLEVFLAFMQFNNLSRVAEELGQSTVSVHRSLHSLEEGLRCPLFKREGRNLTPTPAAKAFAVYAQRIIDDCEAGMRKAIEVAGLNTHRMKIGALFSLTLRCIPQLVIGLKLRMPELEIDLMLGSNRELLQALEDERIDAAVIGMHELVVGNKFVSLPMFYDDVLLAVPHESPHAGKTSIDLQEIRNEKFVALNEGFVTSESFNHVFEKAGFRPEIVMRVGDIFSLINLVSGGVGYGLLPRRVAEFVPRIHLIPLDTKYRSRQSIALLIPKNRERDANLRALVAECRVYGNRENAR